MDLTGRRRVRWARIGGARTDTKHQYEYKCLDCGFVGWTRHIGIARRWAEQFDTPTLTGGSSAAQANQEKA